MQLKAYGDDKFISAVGRWADLVEGEVKVGLVNDNGRAVEGVDSRNWLIFW